MSFRHPHRLMALLAGVYGVTLAVMLWLSSVFAISVFAFVALYFVGVMITFGAFFWVSMKYQDMCDHYYDQV